MKNGPVSMNKNILVFLWLAKILSIAVFRSLLYSLIGFSSINSSAISAFSFISKGSLLILEDEGFSERPSKVRLWYFLTPYTRNFSSIF